MERKGNENMKKILMIIPYNIFPPYWGGANRNYNLAKQLLKKHKIFIMYNDYKQIEKHTLDCNEYRELYTNRNVKIISIKSLGKFSQLYNFNMIKEAKKIIKKEKIDFVLVEHLWSGFHGILLKYFTNIPYILDEHNVEFLRFERMKRGNKIVRYFLKWFEKLACKKAHKILCVSEVDRDFLASKLDVDQKKIIIIPNGIDFQKFFPNDSKREKIRNKLEIENSPAVLFFGKLDYIPNKEAVRIIKFEILPRVIKENSNIKFIIVGDKPPKEYSHKNIIFTGLVDNIEDYINASDVVISPLVSGGGTRFKILEALACGKNVISTKIGAEGLNSKGVENILQIHDNWDNFSEAITSSIKMKNSIVNKEYLESYSWDIIDKLSNDVF